ncbi:MAG: hypothetical protein ACE5EF_07495, partial [Dehalococcoidia bacterium]
MATLAGAAPPGRNRLLFHLRRYTLQYVAGFLMLIAATVAQQLGPLVLRFGIDAIKEGTSALVLAGFAGLILAFAAIEGTLR